MAGEWRLSDVEFDVVWRGQGLARPPYPLEVPSPGATEEERAEIVTEVTEELAARGIGEIEQRELVDALRLLAASETVIDAHLVLDEHLRLAAARTGDRAVMVLQLGGQVLVRTGPGPHLTSALAELLPRTAPAPGQSLRLPYRALADALRRLGETNSAWEFEQALKAAGVRGQDVRWIAGLATAASGNGAQFGVTVRDHHGVELRRSVLSWYATEAGGVLIQRQDGDDWVTIAPGDPARLVARLEDLTGAG